ncbi:DUF6207 family protein [Streptomyces sp. NPDC102487]|uniref:DUF6207 family protein n=1 Tax=Streptomyces sp. NPDC102487 TaxID=3366182 RepID=UPI003823AB6B
MKAAGRRNPSTCPGVRPYVETINETHLSRAGRLVADAAAADDATALAFQQLLDWATATAEQPRVRLRCYLDLRSPPPRRRHPVESGWPPVLPLQACSHAFCLPTGAGRPGTSGEGRTGPSDYPTCSPSRGGATPARHMGEGPTLVRCASCRSGPQWPAVRGTPIAVNTVARHAPSERNLPRPD